MPGCGTPLRYPGWVGTHGELFEDAIETGGLRVSIWSEKALALPGLVLLPLDMAVILDAHRLPGAFHKDPVDRLLVAPARHHDAILLTEDRQIRDYGRQRYLRARSASASE